MKMMEVIEDIIDDQAERLGVATHAQVSDIGMREYHADNGDFPHLSASLAHLMISATPRHAWEASPRLNPDFVEERKRHFDIGTVFHRMMLGEGHGVVECDFPDWRTKAAREARDEAIAEGRIPLLAHEYGSATSQLDRMVNSALNALDRNDLDFPRGWDVEKTLTWRQDGAWNRCRPDMIDCDQRWCVDFKTTAGLAHPRAFVKSSMAYGIDMRAAHYLDGLAAVWPGKKWRYVFVVTEKSPPYATSLVELGERTIAMGRSKMRLARRMWAKCVAEDRWPAWERGVVTASAPEWAVSEWVGELCDRGEDVPDALTDGGDIETGGAADG